MDAERVDREPSLAALLPAFLGVLPAVLRDVERVLRTEWPDYADFLARSREEVAVAGRDALRRIVETAATRAAPRPSTPAQAQGELTLFEQIGRAQWREGRELTPLLAAYQAGTQVAWRQVARTAVEQGVPADAVALLAEAVFVLVDQLSSASVRGYVQEQSAAAAERERARGDLAELLLSDRSDMALVRATAQRARWPVPATVAVVLVDGPSGQALDLVSRLDSLSLPVRRPDALGVLVPDPDGPGRRRRLAQTLRGAAATVGPTVPLSHLPASLRVTQVAARLLREGLLPADPLFVDEHLDAVIVHRDPRLLEGLQARVLAPLAELAPETRQRLEETLRSWLRHMGEAPAVAAELHVHRQTVRYRMGQLRELFGAALDDPDERLRLLLALAWQPAR